MAEQEVPQEPAMERFQLPLVTWIQARFLLFHFSNQTQPFQHYQMHLQLLQPAHRMFLCLLHQVPKRVVPVM
jgi:hypothetical protein